MSDHEEPDDLEHDNPDGELVDLFLDRERFVADGRGDEEDYARALEQP